MEHNFSEYSDTALYYAIVGNDTAAEQAFEELYDRLASDVFRYCRRVLGSHSMAEDITQETFVRLFKSASRERSMTNLRAYVFRIARNLCLNTKVSKHTGLTMLEEFHLPPTTIQYEQKDLVDCIRSAVECLPIEYREAFVLREYNGLSYAEISDVLGLSSATVKVRLYRAKQKIRQLLAPYIEETNL